MHLCDNVNRDAIQIELRLASRYTSAFSTTLINESFIIDFNVVVISPQYVWVKIFIAPRVLSEHPCPIRLALSKMNRFRDGDERLDRKDNPGMV